MVNQWIRSRDCYIDIDACVRSSSDIKSLAPEYDSGDHLHLNAAAGERAAEEIFRTITRIRKRRAAI